MRLLFISFFLLVSPINCLAGYLGDHLQEKINNADSNAEIPVIVYFKTDSGSGISNADNHQVLKRIRGAAKKDVKAFKSARKELRRQHIQNKRIVAETSNKQVKKILKQHKKGVDRELWLINALAVSLPSKLIIALTDHADVDHIKLDAKIKLSENTTGTSSSPPTWNLDVVKAPNLWVEGVVGQDVVIASMDTGVDYSHPDLAVSWRGGTNSWFDPYLEYPDQPHDGIGHGTQVMGVMLGGDASGNNIGVAPGARWISVKIFRDNGSATLSAIHSGFQWLLDPDNDPSTDDAPDIVNNSWGSTSTFSDCDTEFHADIDALKTAGIEVVFAAGNSGPNMTSLYSPADYAGVVSVGSVDEFMTLANNSSRGSSLCSSGFYPNLVAPGVGIYTADLSFGLGTLLDPYKTVEGTSFAAPHLSGIIALLKSAEPMVGHCEIRTALYDSAIDLGAPGADNVTGYGLVDAQAALLKLRNPSGEDSDGDGVFDSCDNCITHSNPLQIDTDGDGYGNACDADFNNDNYVNALDIQPFVIEYLAHSPLVDLTEDEAFNSFDILQLARLFYKIPGPSALAP